MRLLIHPLPALLLVTLAPLQALAQAPKPGPPAAPAAPARGASDGTSAKPASGPALSPTAPPRPRVAIIEFLLEGEGAAPAMAMQLQDGFVLGLVREGTDVLDVGDVGKRLAASPELQKCETSPCLKRLGDVLKVRFVLRVRTTVSGNSYKMTARLFSTEGAAPAALPLAAHSRSCDVCTVAEAREHMIRLADGVRAPMEDKPGPPPPPPPPPPPQRSLTGPLLALAASAVGIAAGAFVVGTADGKRQSALGGALVGASAAAAVIGLYITFDAAAEPVGAKKTAVIGVAATF